MPNHPDVWYASGLEYLREGRREAAWAAWHRSLELSDRHLDAILDRTLPDPAPAVVVERLLPDRPEILVRAAQRLFPAPEAAGQREPFLRAALAALTRHGQPLPAEALYLRSTIHEALRQPDEAAAACREAVLHAPGNANWRYEYARLLRRLDRLSEAQQELVVLLARHPTYPGAQELYLVVRRELELQAQLR